MRSKRILIAVDGSKSAMTAVRYVGETADPGGLSVHLFSVISPMPESFWDSEVDPGSASKDAEAARWEAEQTRISEAFLQKARQVLISSGMAPQRVTFTIHRRDRGIATDIAAEAQRGYDAVVLGRRGNNPAPELQIGNVATRIANTLHHFPLWIVDGPIRKGRVLVAMDCSKSALRALAHACDMLDPACGQICLLHVIREAVGQMPDEAGAAAETRQFLEELNRRRIQKAETVMGRCFLDGVGKLRERGFDENQILTRVVTGAASRAGAVVGEAKKNGYGTIVMGRQGLSPEEDFFMGQVCSKVLQLTAGTTVWIVS